MESSSIWNEVRKVYERIEDLNFVQPLCVLNDEHCEKFPTVLYSLPCCCTVCSSCYVRLNQNRLAQCPVHKESYLKQNLTATRLTVKDVLKMKVLCPASEIGCSFKLRINDLTHHCDECCYTTTKCPFDCGRDVLKLHLQEHLEKCCINRIDKCERCEQDVALSFKEQHERKCGGKQQSCEQGPSQVTPDEQESEYLESCSERVPCKFSALGCKYEGKRINVIDHEKIDNHIEIFVTAFHRMMQCVDAIQELKDSLNKTPTGIMKETLDSIKMTFLDTTKNIARDLEANMKTISEDLLVSSDVTSTSNVATSSSNNLAHVRDVASKKLDRFFEEQAAKFENELLKCYNATEGLLGDAFKKRIAEVLGEKNYSNDLLERRLAENVSEMLQSIQNSYFEKVKNLVETIPSTSEEKTDVEEDSRNHTEPPVTDASAMEGNRANNVESIMKAQADDTENIISTAIKRLQEAALENFKQVLRSTNQSFEKTLENTIKTETSNIVSVMTGNFSSALEGIFEQIQQKSKEEISRNLSSTVEKLTSNVKSIIATSSKETENKLKEYLDAVTNAINSTTGDSAQNEKALPKKNELFVFGQQRM